MTLGKADLLQQRGENHCYALADYFVFYTFLGIHKALRNSPAMAAGIYKRLWSTEDMVAQIEAQSA